MGSIETRTFEKLRSITSVSVSYQNPAASEFTDCTVLTIAHRLNTLMDYARSMVLDKGQTTQMDSPLLADTSSVFYSMARDVGIV